MEKEFTMTDIREMYLNCVGVWDSFKKDIKLAPKDLYNLISIKKTIELEYQKLSEMLVTIFTRHECPMNEQQNGYTIPPEKMDVVNEELTQLSNETVTIQYQKVHIGDDSLIPSELMEGFYDFFEI